MNAYSDWFQKVAGAPPHPWQAELGGDATLRDRLLRIPTGFGKTAGTVIPWLFHRVVQGDRRWPTRLVFSLPMRVLVEQTERAVRGWTQSLAAPPPVYVLLGGREEARWLDQLDRPAILIGTQDMLLSRALNRGYGSARGAWPMEMGQLLRDALWVVDEVQLMDVGLATTAQLRAFLAQDEAALGPAPKPTAIWWMSATLQPRWLETVDYARVSAAAPASQTSIPPAARTGALWEIPKLLRLEPSVSAPDEIAKRAHALHQAGQTTLVVLNTVDRASKTFRELQKLVAKRGAAAPELRLVHSRFRGAERRRWDFLQRGATVAAAGRIIVSTQVIEAGVDLSAQCLVTDLAPWASLVQRFGRCARYAGDTGVVHVVGSPAEGAKAAPYTGEELAAAAAALTQLGTPDVGPRTLEAVEARWAEHEPERLRALYPYAPLHVLRRRDFDDLFDTTPDLSGADLDVGRYIRTGEERDVSVFWRPIEDDGRRVLDAVEAPTRDELCPVAIGDVRKWLEGSHRAWARDYVDGHWHRVEPRRVYPGMQLLLSHREGGYDPIAGWDPSAKLPVSAPESDAADAAADTRLIDGSASADADALAVAQWKTIATHAREAGEAAADLARELALPAALGDCLTLAARWHDVGKGHAQFQAAIRDDARARAGGTAVRRDLAKAPHDAWRRPDPYPARPGFRHELASTLALFETLRAVDPQHPALLGDCQELLDALGVAPAEAPAISLREHPLGRELAALDADAFDLVAYLVCAHHGKVRCAWSSTPRDQERDHGGIHGVVEGDQLAALELPDAAGTPVTLPTLTLSLDAAAMGLGPRYGRSWSDRVQGLLRRWGPATLAYLEACLRVADWRASALTTETQS